MRHLTSNDQINLYSVGSTPVELILMESNQFYCVGPTPVGIILKESNQCIQRWVLARGNNAKRIIRKRHLTSKDQIN